MLSISRLNSLPIPDVQGKYEPSMIYLVKRSDGFVQMLFTSADGTLVGESMEPSDIIQVTAEEVVAGQNAPLFVVNPGSGVCMVKYLSQGAWSWVPLAGGAYELTALGIETALGYVPADAAVLGDIETALAAILAPAAGGEPK